MGAGMNHFWKKIEIYVKAIVNIIIFCLVVLGVIYFVPRLLGFFVPFVIGAIIAWISNPLVRFFERKLKIRRKTGTAVVIITVIGVVVILGYLLVGWLVNQTTGFLEEWPVLWEGFKVEFQALGETMNRLLERLPQDIQDTLSDFQGNISALLGDMVTNISTPTFEAVGGFFKSLPSIIIGIVMCLLSAYFFIAEREYLHRGLHNHIPKNFMDKWRLVLDSIKQSVGGYFKAQLKIEIWVYLLMLVGFFILKVDYAFVIALGIAFLDFLPIFGTGMVLLPWAVIKFFNADYFTFIGLLIIWGVGQLVRQIIQPKIMGDTIGVPPIQTLFLLYIGYQLRGVLGMIVALPIGIILYNLYRAGIFEKTKKSLQILWGGINRFRQL